MTDYTMRDFRARHGKKKKFKNRGDWGADGAISLLGTVPDREVAELVGVTRQAVSLMRVKLGIPTANPKGFPEEHIPLLGTMTDKALSEKIGVHNNFIGDQRRLRGIPRFHKPILCGTRYSYMTGCRCEECTRANREGMYEWQAKNPEKAQAIADRQRDKALATAPHDPGKVSWYVLGCRCDGCRSEMRTYNRANRERRKMNAGRV